MTVDLQDAKIDGQGKSLLKLPIYRCEGHPLDVLFEFLTIHDVSAVDK